ncbi:MAG: hypothetical protein ACYCR4_13765, partial [Acidimicrobiales bacterium]
MSRSVRRPLPDHTAGPGRDLAAWLALALVVAGIVVLTTRGMGLGVSRAGAAAHRPHLPSPHGYTLRSLPVPTSVPGETVLPGSRMTSATTVPTTASTDPTAVLTTTTAVLTTTTAVLTTTTTVPTTTPAVPTTTTRPAPPRHAHPAVGPSPRHAAHPVAPAPRAPVLAPALVSTRWPGNFQYPDDVTATYAVDTSGGVVSATAAWSGASVL